MLQRQAEFDLKADYIRWRQPSFSFAAHAFMYEAAAKAELLRIENELEMQVSNPVQVHRRIWVSQTGRSRGTGPTPAALPTPQAAAPHTKRLHDASQQFSRLHCCSTSSTMRSWRSCLAAWAAHPSLCSRQVLACHMNTVAKQCAGSCPRLFPELAFIVKRRGL